MKYQNYIVTSLIAILTYYWVGFDFIDYVIFLIIAATISILVVAFGNGEKIAYSKLKEGEIDISKATEVNVSTFKYLLFSLPLLAVISGFAFMVMFAVNQSMHTEYYPISNIHFEIQGLLINLLPFLLNIVIYRNKERWLTNLKNKYFFVLGMSIFIPILIPFDVLRVVMISLLFAYTTDAQRVYNQKRSLPF